MKYTNVKGDFNLNCNKMPEMGSEIYLNGCGCNCLWNEMQAEGGDERNVAEAIRAIGRKRHDDDCMPNDDFEAWPVGMAYVPMQLWEEPFELAKGLHAGTIFPSLRLPFRGGGR